MVEQFGDAYRAYRRQVPMFIPRRGRWRGLLEAGDGQIEQQKPTDS